MEPSEARLYEIFKKLGITDYTIHEHEAIFTSKEAEDAGISLPGLSLKNLLVKDRKTERFYLLILDDHRKMDEKHFRQVTGWQKIRFAKPEELMEILGLTPGSVSPFGLINDADGAVTVVLEKAVTDAEEDELVNFHPNRNTATLGLRKRDFLQFLEYIGCEVVWER